MNEKPSVVEFEPRFKAPESKTARKAKKRRKAQLDDIAGWEIMTLGAAFAQSYFGLKNAAERTKLLCQLSLAIAGALVTLIGVARFAMLLLHK